MKQYLKVSTILQKAKEEISDALSADDDQLHALRITHGLQREIDRMSAVTGTDSGTPGGVEVLGPPKTIFGQPVAKKTVLADLTPKQLQIEALRNEIDVAFATFTETDSEVLLKSLNEVVIRGVGKKAGLNITKDDPKKVTIAFVDKIKKAIIQNKQDAAEALLKAESEVSTLAANLEAAETALNAANEGGDTAIITEAQATFEKTVSDHFEAVKSLNALKGDA